MDPLQAEDPRRIGGYQLLGRLGAGGMGTVYLGRSPAGLPVAIKLVHTELADEPSFRTRFAREVTAARAVSGAFTAPVIDADPNARSPWLVTAFLPGMTLHEAVIRHGPFPIPAVYALGASLAEALVSVHRVGVVHRDLKPANVILAPDGPRLIDFGIAHAADAAVVTRTGSVVGSPGFLAPEQAVGGATGPASDVFALGAVLTFAATGESPFGRGGAPALIYRVVHDAPRLDGVQDPELRALLAACLDKNPWNRPDPGHVLGRLAAHAPAAEVLHGTGWLPDSVADGIARAEQPATLPAPGRRRFLALGGGAVAAVATGGVAVALLTRTGGSDAAASPSPIVLSPTPTPTATPGEPKRRWSRSFPGDPYDGLGVGSGIVVVSGDEGNLYGLTASTGKQRWHHKVGDRGAGAATWRTPVIAGRRLYVGWPDTNGLLYSFDVVTGQEHWRFTVPFDARMPAVSGGLVWIGGGDGALHAVDAATGAARWSRAIGNVLSGRPFATGGTVFADTTTALYALDAVTGKTRWKASMPGGAVAPVAANGVVYCADKEGELYALGAADGKQRWKFVGGTSIGLPYVSGGVVYVADGSGNMNALDAATGKTRWSVPTGEQSVGRAAVGDGLVCFSAGSGLTAVDAATGRVRWEGGIGGEVRGEPAIANGLVHVACETGRIYAYTAKGA
ncbi:PQQ-binding-like beta-propeller repeat protein [Actinomadura sp. DC4]|uniref:outer membrane protein assembly factor BamB family protein n=1 Tax=Actinomadura sp. DC4 TaxID=3055069 RepID=UPI0025AF1DF0|nr:PQQ-binding-like beta-propeller repeat protein [Actinomadura sp. DC4]MDN3357927.1 PQQ-binding-like beta-propeller repeat protein [Actinomadura sp. DC4]